jgi:hypothetical protein
VCFSDPFVKEKLEESHDDVNVSSYKKFLVGEIEDERFLSIDYDNVTLNLKDYIRRYIIIWKNGSRSEYTVDDTFGWEIPYVSYNGLWYGIIIKCFALEITDKNVLALNVEVNHTIFSNSLRPSKMKFFVFSHLRNQILRSLKTVKWQWPPRNDDSAYAMDFWIRDSEVMVRRNKKKDPCMDQGLHYDSQVINSYLQNVTCRAPYQAYVAKTTPICKTRQMMKTAEFSLTDGKIDRYPPPCRSLEKIISTYEEYNHDNLEQKNGWFSIGISTMDSYYKEIIENKVCGL